MSVKDDFERLDLNEFQHFVDAKQVEHLHLDFKLVTHLPFSREERKSLAEALSGFANSDGGLIVWGVDCRKNDDGIDCAQRLAPVHDVALLLSELNTYTGQAVNPDVEGVRHKAIALQGKQGFAVTMVPASDAGPHQAKCGEDRYFKRSSASFIRMEHFDIEDMFGRRKRPRLVPYHRITNLVSVGADHTMKIVVGIENSGRGTAKNLFFELALPPGFRLARYGIDDNGAHGLPRLAKATDARSIAFGGPQSISLHPGMKIDVTAVECHVISKAHQVHSDLSLSYKLAAEDAPLKEGALEVSGNRIVATALGLIP